MPLTDLNMDQSKVTYSVSFDNAPEAMFTWNDNEKVIDFDGSIDFVNATYTISVNLACTAANGTLLESNY